MKKSVCLTMLILIAALIMSQNALAFDFPLMGGKFTELTPKNDAVEIPVEDISDGKAHYFKVKASDGVMVSFFAIKSGDGVIRAAVDSCDVCFQSGKGYRQEGDYMVCENCGQKFASNKINEIKGGCNPAPLERMIRGENLIISMDEITKNSWYCKFKQQ